MEVVKRVLWLSLGAVFCFTAPAVAYPARGGGDDSCGSCHTNKAFENQAVFQLINKKTKEKVVKGDGHFLGQPQTLSLMKTEYLYPKIGDRLSPKQWAQNGSTDMTERAHDRVREILRSYFPTHISKEVDDRIRERFPIRLPRKELEGPTGRW